MCIDTSFNSRDRRNYDPNEIYLDDFYSYGGYESDFDIDIMFASFGIGRYVLLQMISYGYEIGLSVYIPNENKIQGLLGLEASIYVGMGFIVEPLIGIKLKTLLSAPLLIRKEENDTDLSDNQTHKIIGYRNDVLGMIALIPFVGLRIHFTADSIISLQLSAGLLTGYSSMDNVILKPDFGISMRIVLDGR